MIGFVIDLVYQVFFLGMYGQKIASTHQVVLLNCSDDGEVRVVTSHCTARLSHKCFYNIGTQTLILMTNEIQI
jgi:hypothetical protein